MIRLSFFAFTFLNVSCFAQEIISAGKKFNFKTYNNEDGLTVLNINHLFQSEKGPMIICGRAGLNLFDGVGFKVIDKSNGLLFSNGNAAVEDNKGNLWIGGRGIYKLEKGKARLVDSVGLNRSSTEYLYKDNDGSIWAASNSRISHYDPEKPDKPLRIYTVNDRIRFIKRRRDGKLMAGGETSYSVLEKDTFVVIASGGPVYQLIEFEDGREWTCGWGTGIREFKNDKHIRTYEFGTGILDLTRDKKGNIWAVSWDKGVFKFDGKNFINYSSREGLPGNIFWSVCCDKEGNVWFGGWGDGLVKFSDDKFSYLNKDYGLTGDRGSIFSDSKNNTWFVSGTGASCYNPRDGSIKNFETCNGQKFLHITEGCIDSLDNVWLIGYVDYQYRISNDKVEMFHKKGGITGLFDRKGNLWLGGDHVGAWRHGTNGSKQFLIHEDSHVNRVTGLLEDKNGIWCMNEAPGISFCTADTIYNFNGKNGFIDGKILNIQKESDDVYWFRVSGRGIFRYRFSNLKFTLLDSLTSYHSFPSNEISVPFFYKDKVYFGTSKGLAVISREDFDKRNIRLRIFDKSNGFLSIYCSPLMMQGDNLWIGTAKGFYCYNTNNTDSNKVEPVTYINDIKLYFEAADWNKYSSGTDEQGLPVSLKLPYNQNHLTFSFTGISFTAPEKVLYQYKLQGLDEKWSPESNKREVIYPNIPPGTYTFMVKSCNNDGVWNSKPAAFVFTISPPFWKSTWFYILCAALLVCMFYIYVRWRERRLKKENLALEDRVNQRTQQLKTALQQIEEKNKEITDSISYASKIQSVLLPSEKEISRSFDDAFIFFSPKDIVSGDFFWIMEKENLVYLAVCDSTGHGVPGAFMSLLNINYLNEAIAEKNLEKPGEVFDYVRQHLISSISKEGQKDGFDGILVCFDKRRNRFTYAAANNMPVLIRKGQMMEMKQDKMPVGKGEKDVPFSLFDQQFEKGDMLYLYTDGYADQFGGEKGKKFKYRQLDDLLITVHHLPASEQLSIITKKFNDWKGSLEQVDDVCIIGIRL
jgi:serine phosphatase RsbU (regulator of sigma subunit)/ligand-binding sensor domain-containing protein